MPPDGVTVQALCVAGEASGDLLLAPVVRELLTRHHRVSGMGGAHSLSAGLVPIDGAHAPNASGLLEVVGAIPSSVKAYVRLRQAMKDASRLVLVDCPEINMRLARVAVRLGIPTYYLAPPQAWAWRPWRAKQLTRVTRVGCLFDFEAQWYRERGVHADWVGHPLAAAPPPLRPASQSIALLPGSRSWECQIMIPLMLDAMKRHVARHGPCDVHIGVAPTAPRAFIDFHAQQSGLCIRLHGSARAALAASRFAVVAAGTATLEAALARRPTLILGRAHPASAMILKRFLRVKHVGLPNLVLGRMAFPELLQEAATGHAIANALADMITNEHQFEDCFQELVARLQPQGRHDSWAANIADTVVTGR